MSSPVGHLHLGHHVQPSLLTAGEDTDLSRGCSTQVQGPTLTLPICQTSLIDLAFSSLSSYEFVLSIPLSTEFQKISPTQCISISA